MENSRPTWTKLNDLLREARKEEEVLRMFETEKARLEPNKRWLTRIWQRYIRLRRNRERKEMKNLLEVK